MAKTVGPLLSQDAHGSLSKLLTYSNKRTGQQVRQYNKPLAPPSAKQRGQRRLTEFLVAHWQNMTAAQRATWETNAKASGRNLPGYQYFLREAQRDLYTHHGLVGYWHCNEIIGGKILDLSGNNIHGTLKPSYPADAPSLITSKKSKFGKALQYNGVDEYVSLVDKKILKITGALTITALIKATAGAVVTDSHDSSSPGPVLFGKDGFFLYIDGMTYPDNRYNIPWVNDPFDNTWHNITATRLANVMNLYVDGVLDNSDACSVGDIQHPFNKWSFGVDRVEGSKTKYLTGIADEICIYNRALTVAELRTRYKFAQQ